MSKQLDILALEPFYGGARKAMLETVIRCSRHRWTLLTLPPRRIERRLIAAANWFSEQLSRHWVGPIDLLFTSEALNLASLLQLMPALAPYPSVVYFHENQLPDISVQSDGPLDLVNLNTASAATDIWFNSDYHRRTFLARASALVNRHEELSSMNPMNGLRQRSRVMHPPVDLDIVTLVTSTATVQRNPRAIFLETRDSDISLLNAALADLALREVPFSAIIVGPAGELSRSIPQRTISEQDDAAQVRGMLESGVILSCKTHAAMDYQMLRAMLAGCRPVLPDAGVYPDLLPPELHDDCLYPVNSDALADHLAHVLHPDAAAWHHNGFHAAFRSFDAITACRAFDDRLERLVIDGVHASQSE